ncbi:MAG: hypothetical protein Q9212_005118 [Teloschistes hypoglaucus]
MFLQDYRLHPQAKFEFYSSLYPAPTSSNRIRTPRRYTTTLVMLYNFQLAELPGTYKAGHARTDIATFQEIYTTAHRMEEHCIVGRGQASRLAWEPVGASHLRHTDLSTPK